MDRLLKWLFGILLLNVLYLLSQVQTGGASQEPSKEAKASKEPERAPIARIRVALGFDGSRFVFHNAEPFDLLQVALDLNPGMFSSGYVVGLGTVKAGETRFLNASSFQKRNGVRFVVGLDEPERARVTGFDKNGEELFFTVSVVGVP